MEAAYRIFIFNEHELFHLILTFISLFPSLNIINLAEFRINHYISNR